MEEGGTWEGKIGERDKEEEKWEKINLLVRLVTEIPSKFCMVDYEC